VTIVNILWYFGIFFPYLVRCAKKILAALFRFHCRRGAINAGINICGSDVHFNFGVITHSAE
jgi:hypothetical protein